MNARAKIIGCSLFAITLAAAILLIFHDKSELIGTAETEQAKPPPLSALDEYLAHPPVVENPSWKLITPPHESIPIDLKRFREGPTEKDRAVAIGCLAYTSQHLAKAPVTREAAKELLRTWVIPNLNLTKTLPRTCAYSWRDAVHFIRKAYKTMGDLEMSRQFLALMRDEGEVQDDREMAVYLMAYDYALNKEYPEAISTFNTLSKDSRWADQRPRVIGIWQKMQAEEEKAAIKTPTKPESKR